jgi:uncharacterized membrane protein YdfJ with MMPL/SSD domain
MIRFILRHKRWVVFGWVALAALGVVTLGRLGPRLDYTYTTPGQPGYESNVSITRRFGLDPAFEAMLPVLTLPEGMTLADPAGRQMAAETFAAVRTAGPVIYSDFATTRDPVFLLDGGRSTWALVSIPNPDYGPGLHVEGHVEPAIAAAVPGGAQFRMTGFAKMLSNAGPNAGNLFKGMLFGVCLALVTLIIVYGSPIAILPILMAIPTVCVTFLGVFALTYVANVSYFVEYVVVLLSLGIGIGSEWLYGVPATDAIRAWIPTVEFASLFGLSMDYEVFVLARMREEYDRTGSTREAIVSGLARTGRLVTCAALILMVTFLSLSIDPNQLVRISATTLAVGVVMDAVIIRTLLVPALVSLMGRWSWWLPAGLNRYLPARPSMH